MVSHDLCLTIFLIVLFYISCIKLFTVSLLLKLSWGNRLLPRIIPDFIGSFCHISDLMSPHNVAVYGGLTALATFDRAELHKLVISSSQFKVARLDRER